MKKGLTKEQRYYLARLNAKKGTLGSIFAAYKNPSQAKIDAFHEIAIECRERNGFGLCVLGATCQLFTAGYFYPDSTTGELRARIELPTRTLDFAVVE